MIFVDLYGIMLVLFVYFLDGSTKLICGWSVWISLSEGVLFFLCLNSYSLSLILCVQKQSSSSEVFSTVDNSPPNVKVSKLLQSLSPVSVLKNTNGSGSPQNPNGDQKLAFLVKGIRSKRKRPTLLRVTFLKSFLLEMSQQFAPDESESSEISALKKRKKNKSRRLKCTHCETTTTPQWREGPNGRKTLCNACGIRFRSGRLVLEYRPAASPTFIPTVHSNLHKKIIYMRMKDNDQFDTRKIRAETSGPETRSRLRNFGRPMSYGQWKTRLSGSVELVNFLSKTDVLKY